ncbi:MFS transporter [Promicromonospora sp. NPDC059942]|uniref:MFS transporter n=1 Tax=Promicromonospora sp. NPDC059942 TaxID=3347009 RepID=UPI00365E8F9F
MTEEARTALVRARPSTDVPSANRLPLVAYVLALGTFLMLTTEFVVAGILPEIAGDLRITLASAGSLITVFAVGMVVGAPSMALLTTRLSRRTTLLLALAVFVLGHVFVALASDLTLLMVARFVTALATGAFWAVAAVVAAREAGPALGSRAISVVGAGGSLATVLGVPLGALVAQAVGWRGTFWALAVAAAVASMFIARLVPRDVPAQRAESLRTELADLRSARLWLVLAACVTTTGGVLAAYSFIAPVLTDQAGVSPTLVPLVLTVFGVGSFAGTLVGGRLGDAHPRLVTVMTPAVTTVILLGIALLSGSAPALIALVALLGLFGLSANGVLIHLAVSHAGRAATMGSALSVAAFNVGTAIGTGLGGAALASPLGLDGPAAVGTAVVALTLVPTAALAIGSRRRQGPANPYPPRTENPSCAL